MTLPVHYSRDYTSPAVEDLDGDFICGDFEHEMVALHFARAVNLMDAWQAVAEAAKLVSEEASWPLHIDGYREDLLRAISTLDAALARLAEAEKAQYGR